MSVSGMRSTTRCSSSGWRIPTTHGRPRRSPMIRVSPPALTIARSIPSPRGRRCPRSTACPLAMPPRSMRTPGRLKAHRRGVRDQLDVTVVDARQGCGDRLRSRMNPGAVVIEVSHARVGHVEGAARELRILDRGGEQVEEFPRDLHRTRRPRCIDPRQLALGLVGAHESVDAPELGEHRLDRRLALRAVLAPQLDHTARAHDRLLRAAAIRRARAGRPAPSSSASSGGSLRRVRWLIGCAGVVISCRGVRARPPGSPAAACRRCSRRSARRRSCGLRSAGGRCVTQASATAPPGSTMSLSVRAAQAIARPGLRRRSRRAHPRAADD